MLYQGQTRLVRWLDADTAEITIRVPVPACQMTVETTRHIRLAGINAPEKNTDAGKLAIVWVNGVCPPGPVDVTIIGFEKYGRWLGDVRLGSMDMAKALLAAGHAKPVSYGCEEA